MAHSTSASPISAVRAPAVDLARMRLVLSSGGARRGWIVLVVASAGATAAASQWWWSERLHEAQQRAAPSGEGPALRQSLEQMRLQLQMADARSHELEQQIDALNGRLRESQEELAFFRKAREARR